MKTLLAALVFAAFAVHAQTIPLNFTISATIKYQNQQTTNAQGIVTLLEPKAVTVTTASLLKSLATLAYLNGDYPATNFPTGAKIVYELHPEDTHENRFIVTTSLGVTLCDVSDYLYYEQGQSLLQSGKYDSANKIFPSWKYSYIGQLVFDGTSVEDTRIFFGGLITSTVADVVVKNIGTYKETWKITLPAGIGEGVYDGRDCLVTGTASATGSGTLPLP